MKKTKELTTEEKREYIKKYFKSPKLEAIKKLYELSNHPNPAISLRACSDILKYSKTENEENDNNGLTFEGWENEPIKIEIIEVPEEKHSKERKEKNDN